MKTQGVTTVLVAAGTVTYRNLVTLVLTGVPGIEVVGIAANRAIALAKIEQLRPDILMLDLDIGSLEVLQHLRESGSDVVMIVLSGTTEADASVTIEALELGAVDFVAKPISRVSDEHVQIEIVRIDLQPRIEAFARSLQVRKLLRCVARRDSATVATPAPSQADKTPRQIDVAADADVVAPLDDIATEIMCRVRQGMVV